MAKKSDKQEIAKVQPDILIPKNLVNELRGLIEETRSGIAHAVNSAMVQLYWQIGTRIRTEVLQHERADYGQQIVTTVSAQLTNEIGSGFSRPHSLKMLQSTEFLVVLRFSLLCRGSSGNCLDTVKKIELESFFGANFPQSPPHTGFLRRDVSHRKLERSNPPIRYYSVFLKTMFRSLFTKPTHGSAGS